MSAQAGTIRSETEDDSAPDDEYADVVDMVRALHRMPAASPEFTALRERIVTRCLPLADHIAKRYANRAQEFDDLIQVARVGLLHAVNRFDPEYNSCFTAFAVPTIMGEVRRYFRDRTWAMSVPRWAKDLHVEIAHAAPLLTQILGHPPTAADISGWLGVSRQEVVDSLVAEESRAPRSLDEHLDADGEGQTVADQIGAEDRGFDLVTERETLKPLLALLPDRERTILTMRFFGSMTQSEIAQRVGLSQMQVSRVLQSTLQHLREAIR